MQISVYRFHDTVAIGAVDTHYMSAESARNLAHALLGVARSIESVRFSDSNCGTVTTEAQRSSAYVQTGISDGNVQELLLYAVNTGEWYDQHMKMARDNWSITQWAMHANTVVSSYKREYGRFRLPAVDKRELAYRLRDHYRERVAEETRFSQEKQGS